MALDQGRPLPGSDEFGQAMDRRKRSGPLRGCCVMGAKMPPGRIQQEALGDGGAHAPAERIDPCGGDICPAPARAEFLPAHAVRLRGAASARVACHRRGCIGAWQSGCCTRPPPLIHSHDARRHTAWSCLHLHQAPIIFGAIGVSRSVHVPPPSRASRQKPPPVVITGPCRRRR